MSRQDPFEKMSMLAYHPDCDECEHCIDLLEQAPADMMFCHSLSEYDPYPVEHCGFSPREED